ncbi:MAG TPA: hypothetical protein VKU02_34030 [Gemmataceae bacterium]|nr:hypothetical protein [Gemmataceae bacterium]
MLILRRSHVGWIAVALLASAWPVRAADVDPYLPDDTEVVLTVNTKQLLDSPLVKKHFEQQLRELLKSNDEISSVFTTLGFDPFKDLASITGAMSMVGNDAKGLLIAHGQFDKAKFEAKAEEVAKSMGDVLKIHKEGERKVYEVKHDPAEKPHFVGLVDASTIVASTEKPYVLDALAKSNSKKSTAPKKAIQELIEKVDGKQSVWFAATAQAFLKGDLSGDERAKKNLEKINNLSAGVTVNTGVKVGLTIATKTPANAKELADEIKEGLSQVKGLLALMADQDKRLAPLVDVITNLRTNTDGNTIAVQGDVSAEVIEKALKKN